MVLLLKTTLPYLTQHVEVEGTRAFPLLSDVHGAERYLATRGGRYAATQLQTLKSTTATCLLGRLVEQWHNVVGVTSHHLIVPKSYSMRWN